MRARSASGLTPLTRGDVDVVEAAVLADDALRLGQRQQRHAGAAERFAAAELNDADDRVARRGSPAGDDDLLADLQARAFCGRLVDRHFAGALAGSVPGSA